jgi:hypothetical protein
MPSAYVTSSGSRKQIKMNYASYDTNIVQAHKCKIIGWVGKFVNPSEIGTIEQLHMLRDVWASGTARWVKVSAAQVKAHMDDVDERISRGEVVVKVRKQRSDAGKSRGGKRKASEKENARPTKKARRSRTQLAPKSNAVIDSDSEDSDDNEDTEH